MDSHHAFDAQTAKLPAFSLFWIRRLVRVGEFRGIRRSMTALTSNLPHGLDRSAGSDGKADPQVPLAPRTLEGFGTVGHDRPNLGRFFPRVRDRRIAALGHRAPVGGVEPHQQYVTRSSECLVWIVEHVSRVRARRWVVTRIRSVGRGGNAARRSGRWRGSCRADSARTRAYSNGECRRDVSIDVDGFDVGVLDPPWR